MVEPGQDQSSVAAGEAAIELTGPSDVLEVDEVRRRAAGGAATLGVRNVLMLVLGLGGNLVLARLLAPRDFGLVALGSTLVLVGSYLADGGIGAALVGRRTPPERRELEAVLAVQLSFTVALAAAFAAVAWPFGRSGLVPALMLCALPLMTLRAPSGIVLERELSYRTIAKVDLVEAIVQYAWAIAAVAAGLGVWGLASAAVARALAGSVAMMALGPLGLVPPRWSWRRVRPILGFGTRFQAVTVVALGRDQSLNLGIASIGGIASLGLWSLAFRVMQVPLLLSGTLNRISYPAMARLIEAGQDVRATIERGVEVVAFAVGVIVVGIAGGAAGLVPGLLGHRWGHVPAIVLWGALALMISVPISSAAVGYLYAVGDAQAVLRSVVAHTLTWVVLGLALLAPAGIAGIGAAWAVAAAVEVALLACAVKRRTGARPLARLAPPLAVAVAAGGAGWAIASLGGRDALSGLGGLLAAEALFAGGLLALRPSIVRDAVSTLRKGLREARAG